MTQPYIYDEQATFMYEDEPSFFQFTDDFQPYDENYNAYQPIRSSWPPSDGNMASTRLPYYEEMALPSHQTRPQQAQNQAPIIQQDISPLSSGSYDLWNGYQIAFDALQVLPYYPAAPIHEIQPIEYSLVSDTDTVPSIPPQQPIVALEWKNNDASTSVKEDSKPAKKRKALGVSPVVEWDTHVVRVTKQPSPRPDPSSKPLEDYMGLFDTTLTATKEKRRRKVFSAQEKKVVKSVRTVGACIQCKFRKKTCSAGHPCPYCARLAGTTSLGTQLCQRESPFIGRSLTQYYSSSSRKRVIDFHLSSTKITGPVRLMYIDGAGPVTRPFGIQTLAVNFEKLELDDRASVLRTVKYGQQTSKKVDTLPKIINVIKPGSLASCDLERWAVDYTQQYSSIKLPHATGFLFGIEYVKKGFPHSDIVDKVTRLVSINFVLRVGVNILSGSVSSRGPIDSPYRTIQAQIDTQLFQSFQTIEESLSTDLQRLIFRSAGSLTRDAVVPVCLCVWQLARLQCMLASQLTNLAAYELKRSKRPAAAAAPPPPPPPPLSASVPVSARSPNASSPPQAQNPANTPRARYSEAENLNHGLNLLLCTFEALFRNACPLLLDWNDTFSKELLKNDEELLAMATRMGRTLRGYRAKGHSRKFRTGFGYNKEMSGRIRRLLRER